MMAHISARCERAIVEAGEVKVFTLRLQGAETDFLETLQPGGYVAVDYPDVSGKQQQRLYSVTRKSTPELFEIAVKRTGHQGVSDSLHATLNEGSLIPISYAGGTITVSALDSARHVFMLAGGIGVTLPIALVRELAGLARAGIGVPHVTLFLCCPTVASIPFLLELLELDLTTAWFNIRIFITREDIKNASSHFCAKRPSDMALRSVTSPDVIVICGGHEFASQNKSKTAQLFPNAKFLVESFTPPTASPGAAPVMPQGSGPRSVRVTVANVNGVLVTDTEKSLLQTLEDGGIPIKSQCRSGVCGRCRVKILSGQCRREPDFCLDDHDKANGYALACCTYPVSEDVALAVGSTQ